MSEITRVPGSYQRPWCACSFELSSNDGREEREYLMAGISNKIRVPDLALMKERGERIVMLPIRFPSTPIRIMHWSPEH